MNLLLTTFADIAPFPNNSNPYNSNPSTSSTDHTLLILVIAIAAVSIVSNIVLGVLLVRAKKRQQPQANLDDKSDSVTRSAV